MKQYVIKVGDQYVAPWGPMTPWALTADQIRAKRFIYTDAWLHLKEFKEYSVLPGIEKGRICRLVPRRKKPNPEQLYRIRLDQEDFNQAQADFGLLHVTRTGFKFVAPEKAGCAQLVQVPYDLAKAIRDLLPHTYTNEDRMSITNEDGFTIIEG